VNHKHEIRRAFHPQLKRFWDHHPTLNDWVVDFVSKPSEQMRDNLVRRFTRCGYSFVPLVTKQLRLSCSISILFLRPGWPGGILNAGDIDNRLKVLFDAFRLPSDSNELGKYTTPLEGETPFYCLLEDDSLVSHISVETDALLVPVAEAETRNDARLVITVALTPTLVTMDNLGFGGR
jgi:hypothetical protein